MAAPAGERVVGPLIAATYWNRVEPRPRTTEVGDVLPARIRDPLWMLTRQWQVGEFQATDSGSPAYVQIRSRTGPVLGWRPAGRGTMQPFAGPLEDVVETEGITGDLATRIEWGLRFGRLLAAQGLSAAKVRAILDAFRGDYPLSTADVEDTDRGGTRLAALSAGRAVDGIAIAQAAGGPLPTDPDVAAEAAKVTAAVTALANELTQTLGAVGEAAAPAWSAPQIEYQVEVAVRHPDTGPLLLRADPDRDAAFDWFTFDALVNVPAGMPAGRVAIAAGPPPPDSYSIVPAFVSFRGMPNHRWWDFERGSTDFGAVKPDLRDVAKLVMMDFMLIHSNDYFVVPFVQAMGTVCRIEQFLVHDVFGTVTLVERADKDAVDPGRRWTCFSIAIADQDGRPADFFFVPPSAGALRMAGEPLEDVRFVRDEQANYVWAIEECAEAADGRPWIGHERHVAEIAKEPAPAPPVSESPLWYRLQTFVPWHWFPMIPVQLDQASGETALERGEMVRPDGRTPEPLGRILAGAPYRVREEAVPRVGVRVLREAVRSRWTSGDTRFWVARRKLAGRGEGSSGLRYDAGETTTPP